MFRESRWLNDDTWVCHRHLPSARIPAAAATCWYSNCSVTRPPKESPPKTVAPTASVEPAKQEKPKRRGSIRLSCAVCNADTYRKPSDVKRNRSGVFFCSSEHAAKYRMGVASVSKAPAKVESFQKCVMCSKPVAKNSKYCSRKCSNRNAHLRSQERKRKLSPPKQTS